MTAPMTMQNNQFVFYRKRIQRKTGGCKNKFVIAVRTTIVSSSIANTKEMLLCMESFGGKEFGLRSMIFDKRVNAEKAWAYLNLRWS